MIRTNLLLGAFLLCTMGVASAEYTVENRGTWPKSWPQELEPLRERSQTYDGPLVQQSHYVIAFTKREEFETAWLSILKTKTPGAPIILRRAPSFWLGKSATAGVCIHTPPRGTEAAPHDTTKRDAKDRTSTTYIELIVDGKVVDLNRIPFPPHTPIVDERFTGDASPKR